MLNTKPLHGNSLYRFLSTRALIRLDLFAIFALIFFSAFEGGCFFVWLRDGFEKAKESVCSLAVVSIEPARAASL